MGSWSGVAAGEGRPTPTQVKFQLRKAALATMADDKNLQEIQKLGGTAIKPVGWDRTGWEAFRYILPSKPGSPNLLLPLYGQGPQCQLPCTPRCCEDQPQGGPRGSAHPHRVQGLLRWSEARDQDKGGDGHVRAAD